MWIFRIFNNAILLCLSLLITQFFYAQTIGTLNHNGLQRTFNYYLPTSWATSENYPLLIVLHGLTQTGSGVMNITKFNEIAEANQFVVCYPDGINNAWNANMNINVSSADDLGFIESLALFFQNQYNTNASRQYLVGFSNGGFMSHKMACESSMCFAGIATISGNMSDTTYAQCNPQFSPAVLHIHGTNDLVVPYNGGSQTGVSVDQTMAKWQSFLNCSANPTQTNMPNNNLTDLSSPVLFNYVGCNSSLQLIKIIGGGHQWPGISTLVGGAGIINMDFYSPQVIWDFLQGKSCPVLGTNQLQENNVQIQPNPVEAELQIALTGSANVQLLNFNGQSVLPEKTVFNQAAIDLSNLNSGIYLLELTQGTRKQIFKIIKI